MYRFKRVCFNEVKELELAFLDPDFKCEELILKAGWDLRSFQQMQFHASITWYGWNEHLVIDHVCFAL